MWQQIKNYYHLTQAFFSALYFNFPSKKLIVIGVTGTDGKTTTVNMIYHILKSVGEKVSMISSVNAAVGNKTFDTGFHVSTPRPWQIQKFLKRAKDTGSEYFVIEATSHGLDQNRLAFVNFTVAVLTNITHEHLDYHKTYENYRDAKLKLFKNVKFSIINADDSSYNHVKNHVSGKVVAYRLKGRGNYNLQNAQAAITATEVLDISRQTAEKALKTFPGVKGRMEEIKMGQPFRSFIDFAHTPNGLKQALKTLRSDLVKEGKIIAVFGAAGERDKSKRPLMGAVADNLADVVVLTSEDPRSEDPQEIARQIAQGIKKKKEGKDLHIITDRKDAINFAIRLARKDDIVAIFGKGHEKSMAYGKKETPWDEFAVVREAIKRINKVRP